MPVAYLGLGSNLGDRRKFIDNAILLLEQLDIKVIKCSSVIETDPVGGPSIQNKYLNAVVKVLTKLTAEQLWGKTSQIEDKLGRKRTVKNAPRIIDIDILLFDNISINTANLIIPHPRMSERDFVLIPLKEIEPKFFNSNNQLDISKFSY